MNLIDIVSPTRTFIDVEGSSKKRVLELSAELIARECPGFNPGELFDSMINRERLGSTGLGHGVAIPHCRLSSCPRPMGTLLRLRDAVDYDTIDNEPVDLLFVLLVPTQATDEHLQLLAQIAERFSSESIRTRLRKAATAEALYAAFLGNG